MSTKALRKDLDAEERSREYRSMITAARTRQLEVTAEGLKRALGLLGIEAPERM
jgi:arginyl-tRNA synthetase